MPLLSQSVPCSVDQRQYEVLPSFLPPAGFPRRKHRPHVLPRSSVRRSVSTLAQSNRLRQRTNGHRSGRGKRGKTENKKQRREEGGRQIRAGSHVQRSGPRLRSISSPLGKEINCPLSFRVELNKLWSDVALRNALEIAPISAHQSFQVIECCLEVLLDPLLRHEIKLRLLKGGIWK